MVELKGPKHKTPDIKYKVDVRCTNCEYQGVAEVWRGYEVIETPCPYCGCKTLRMHACL